METITKVIAEKTVEEYLKLTKKYFNNIEIKHPVFRSKEKLNKIYDLIEQSNNGEIPSRDIYDLVEPDGFEKRKIKLNVCKDLTKEHSESISIYYQTNLYLETKNPIYSVFGYGAFLVDKFTGKLFITPSSYNANFWSKDYKNCKYNQTREIEMGWTWIPLRLDKLELQFLMSGPIRLYEQE